MTNFESLKSKSVEEAAEILSEDGCPPSQMCPPYVLEGEASGSLKNGCKMHWIEWLNAAARNNTPV